MPLKNALNVLRLSIDLIDFERHQKAGKVKALNGFLPLRAFLRNASGGKRVGLVTKKKVSPRLCLGTHKV
jgi:hypothetical protein